MEYQLKFIVDAYEALPDKSSLYAQGLCSLISEREAALRALTRLMMLNLGRRGYWHLDLLGAGLAQLNALPARELEEFLDELRRHFDEVALDG